MNKFIFGIAVALLVVVVNAAKDGDKTFVPLVFPYSWGDDSVQMYAADTPLANQVDQEFTELIEGNYNDDDRAAITIATATASNGIKLYESILAHLPQSIETRLKAIVSNILTERNEQIQKCKLKLTARKMKEITKCATDEAPEIIDTVNKTIHSLHDTNELTTAALNKFRNCMQIDEGQLRNPNHLEPSRLVKICRGTLEWSKRNGCLLLVGGEIVLDTSAFIWHITVKTLESYNTEKVKNTETKIADCAKQKLDQWLATACKGEHVPVLDRR